MTANIDKDKTFASKFAILITLYVAGRTDMASFLCKFISTS